MGTSIVVLVAHGSRNQQANQHVEHLADVASTRLGIPVIAAFLELAEPTIAGALTEAARRAPDGDIIVAPYFLLPGNHTEVDIPAQVQVAAASLGRSIRLEPYLGGHPAVVEGLGAALADALDGAGPGRAEEA